MTRRKDGITCTATTRKGKPCGNPPIRGGAICRYHGGDAPQVKAAAARRLLEELVGPALAQLRRIVADGDVPDAVKMRAIDSILDRTEGKPATKIEGSLSIDSAAEVLRGFLNDADN